MRLRVIRLEPDNPAAKGGRGGNKHFPPVANSFPVSASVSASAAAEAVDNITSPQPASVPAAATAIAGATAVLLRGGGVDAAALVTASANVTVAKDAAAGASAAAEASSGVARTASAAVSAEASLLTGLAFPADGSAGATSDVASVAIRAATGVAGTSASAEAAASTGRAAVARAAVSAAVTLPSGLNRATTSVAAASARVRLLARVKGSVGGLDGDYIGRYQLGGTVPLFLPSRDSKGGPRVPPRLPPLASVYALDTGSHVEDLWVPALHDPGQPAVFAGPLTLGVGYAPGRYAVLYRWSLGGNSVLESSAFFEVQAGGDRAGPVVAAKVLDVAGGQAAVLHAGSGRVMAARDPYLDDGGGP